MKPDPSGVLRIGFSPDDPDSALALRGGMQVRIKGGNRFVISCPYCGARVKGRLKPGTLSHVELCHEAWCPVPTDRELLRRWGLCK